MVPGVLDSTLHSSSSFHYPYSLIHGRHEGEVDATVYVHVGIREILQTQDRSDSKCSALSNLRRWNRWKRSSEAELRSKPPVNE